MYNRQRPNLYYGDQNQKYYLAPSPEVFPSQEGSADDKFKRDTVCTLHTRGRGGGGLDYHLMSMVLFHIVSNTENMF
jgi:hypothetical protein